MGMQQSEFTVPAEDTTLQIDLIVLDGFVLTEMASIVDVIRTANRVCPGPRFKWTFRSLRGGMVESGAGAFVATERLDRHTSADYVFVLGNSNPDHPELSMGRIIDSFTFRGAQVFLLAEAATRYIKERGDRAGRHTTHWENAVLLRERQGSFDTQNQIASQVGRVVTCAGMGATTDVTLELIGRHMSRATMMTVADIFLHERVRNFGSMQPFPGVKTTTTGDAQLDDCIKIMQANIDDPVPIGELVSVLGLSNRSLERRFRTYMGTTPNNFYRELRLARANNLLFNTTLSVREVGLACGFPSGFSAVYKSFYGVTPLSQRRKRKMTAPEMCGILADG